jgi:predicted HTH domain antitoxin
MQVTVELPDDIARCLKEKQPDLARSVLEAIAVEAVRDGTIPTGRAAEMLGISRDEMDAILKRADVYLDYALEDLARDRETHRRLGI